MNVGEREREGERENIIRASRLTKLLMTVYDRTTHHFLEACENSSYFIFLLY